MIMQHGLANTVGANADDERLSLKTFPMNSSETSCRNEPSVNSTEQVNQSTYCHSAAQMPAQSIASAVVDRTVIRNSEISRESNSVVVDCSIGYDILRNLESSMENNSFCHERAVSENDVESSTDYIPSSHSACSSSYGCQMLNIAPATASNGMTANLSTADVMQIISGSAGVDGLPTFPTLGVEDGQQQPRFRKRSEDRCLADGVGWHQSNKEPACVSDPHASLNCNPADFDSFNETAAAVASLEFEVMSSVPFMGQNVETAVKRCWSDPAQWPPSASFSNDYNADSVCEEPSRKSAKFDDHDSDRLAAGIRHHI
jgi:hypothetical protein